MNLNFNTIVLCLFALPAFAQRSSSGFSLYDTGIGFGFHSRSNDFFTEANWEKLPGFHNYHADSSGYSPGHNYSGMLTDWKAWNLDVRFRILSKSPLNWILGFHIQYNDDVRSGMSYWRSAETWWNPNDIDTTFHHLYVYSADRLSICPRLLLSTDPDKRISGYCGIQLSFGLSTNARMDISYEERGHSPDDLQLSYGPPRLLYGEYSTQYLKQVRSLGIGVPAGITFLLGKPGSALSNVAVSLEGSESVLLTRIPEMKKTFAKSSLQAIARVSYRFR